jgi:hypothetical protein
VFNLSEIIICPKCKSEFEVDPHKVGMQYKFCELCRPKPQREKKNINCLFCDKKLSFGVKGKSKPFCDFNHELQFMINNYKTRKQIKKIGCAV